MPRGMVWYTDFGWQFLGKLDPKTGKTEEFPVPELKANFPLGMLDLELDKQGNFWIAQMLQGGFSKFDPATKKFTTYSIPADHNNASTQINMVMPLHSEVDGKVWTQDTGDLSIHRLDIETGKNETITTYPDGRAGTWTLRRGFGFAQQSLLHRHCGGGHIGRADAKTGAITLTPTPAKAAGKPSGPRRGQMDGQDRFFYGDLLLAGTGSACTTPRQISSRNGMPASVDGALRRGS